MNSSYDLLIVGGGAAGLTAAQYGARANLRTLVVEQTANGGQCLLIEGLENYPGFPDPIGGMEFTNRFEEQAKRFGAEFLVSGVQNIEKEDSVFRVQTGEGKITTQAVVLATGAQHRTLDVPGEERLSGKGVSYCATCDGPFFRGKKMIVVGGGDAAFDEAQFLSNLSDNIVLVHRRDRFRAQKALIERVEKNPNIELRTNTVIKGIHGESTMMGIEKVSGVTFQRTDTGEEWTEDTAAVFVFIGSIPQTQLAGDAEKDEAGYIITNERMETSIPGLYAVGDVRTTPFRQLVVAASDGAIAAHAASQYIDELADQRAEAVAV
ncbi:MAG: thioredoxin-disulfide reductase [Spirochaetes bacterium]|jgi:thioredoxin reductase (NADPH)|nr:thioredoxin-disulfide reductase [Spirochaetota bacterium]